MHQRQNAALDPTVHELKALSITARGGTNMHGVPDALKAIFESATADDSFHMIVVSDGAVSDQAETERKAHEATRQPFKCSTVSATLLRFMSSA